MKRPRGFTLIELLVAAAIIAILAGIVVPALAAARRYGYRTTCQTRLREAAGALWAYSVANDGRVPDVISPLVNGSSTVRGFGHPAWRDDEIDPYNREGWPRSLQNLLMPWYLGSDRRIFTCPAATRGWPRKGGPFEATYRDAGRNQPTGVETPPGTYFRESFGFLDGRPMLEFRIRFTADPILNSQIVGASRGAFLRDMVTRDGPNNTGLVRGPHDGGINLINREFGIEYRDLKTIQPDLAPAGAGVLF